MLDDPLTWDASNGAILIERIVSAIVDEGWSIQLDLVGCLNLSIIELGIHQLVGNEEFIGSNQLLTHVNHPQFQDALNEKGDDSLMFAVKKLVQHNLRYQLGHQYFPYTKALSALGEKWKKQPNENIYFQNPYGVFPLQAKPKNQESLNLYYIFAPQTISVIEKMRYSLDDSTFKEISDPEGNITSCSISKKTPLGDSETYRHTLRDSLSLIGLKDASNWKTQTPEQFLFRLLFVKIGKALGSNKGGFFAEPYSANKELKSSGIYYIKSPNTSGMVKAYDMVMSDVYSSYVYRCLGINATNARAVQTLALMKNGANSSSNPYTVISPFAQVEVPGWEHLKGEGKLWDCKVQGMLVEGYHSAWECDPSHSNTTGGFTNVERKVLASQSFPASAFLANNDVIGAGVATPFDNTLVNRSKYLEIDISKPDTWLIPPTSYHFVIVDCGGTLGYKGTGGNKSKSEGWGSNPVMGMLGSLDGMLDSSVNKSTAAAYKLAFQNNPNQSLTMMLQIYNCFGFLSDFPNENDMGYNIDFGGTTGGSLPKTESHYKAIGKIFNGYCPPLYYSLRGKGHPFLLVDKPLKLPISLLSNIPPNSSEMGWESSLSLKLLNDHFRLETTIHNGALHVYRWLTSAIPTIDTDHVEESMLGALKGRSLFGMLWMGNNVNPNESFKNQLWILEKLLTPEYFQEIYTQLFSDLGYLKGGIPAEANLKKLLEGVKDPSPPPSQKPTQKPVIAPPIPAPQIAVWDKQHHASMPLSPFINGIPSNPIWGSRIATPILTNKEKLKKTKAASASCISITGGSQKKSVIETESGACLLRKDYKTMGQVYSEVIAAQLLRGMGVMAPDMRGYKEKGHNYLYSPAIENLVPLNPASLKNLLNGVMSSEKFAYALDFLELWFWSCLIENYDVFGQSYDNTFLLKKTKTSQLGTYSTGVDLEWQFVCVDLGGSFFHRAQGAIKDHYNQFIHSSGQSAGITPKLSMFHHNKMHLPMINDLVENWGKSGWVFKGVEDFDNLMNPSLNNQTYQMMSAVQSVFSKTEWDSLVQQAVYYFLGKSLLLYPKEYPYLDMMVNASIKGTTSPVYQENLEEKELGVQTLYMMYLTQRLEWCLQNIDEITQSLLKK